MTTPTIPVPVDVLRELLKGCRNTDPTGYMCGVCYRGDGNHTPTCPIPALREAVEKAEER